MSSKDNAYKTGQAHGAAGQGQVNTNGMSSVIRQAYQAGWHNGKK